MSFRLPWWSRSRKPSQSFFAVRQEDYGVSHITARGEHGRVTQAMFEVLGGIKGPVGMVLVDLVEPPSEWAYPALPRTIVQESLLAIRDLLGVNLLDAAVFSSREGIEVYLDRFGTLEIRTGTWDEPRLRSLLVEKGFLAVPRLSVLPPPASDPRSWTPELRKRLEAVQETLIEEGANHVTGDTNR